MNILFFPFYRLNPYQTLLKERLERLGCEVRTQEALVPFRDVYGDAPFDVLHLHWTTPFVKDLGWLASWRAWLRLVRDLRSLRREGVTIVWTVHNLANHDQQGEAAERRIMHLIARHADLVITHCAAAARAVGESLTIAPDKLRTLEHASYVEVYPGEIEQGEARDRLGLPREAFVIAFVGLIRPYKNLDRLIECFAGEIAPCHPDAHLLVAGRIAGNRWRAEVQAMSGAHPRIHLMEGYIAPDDLQIFVRAADLIALPFREILTSGSMLMAMSLGRPVVAPRAGCVGEWQGTRGCYLYDPADVPGDDLGGALRRAIANRRDLAAEGDALRLIMKGRRWEAMARNTLALYRHAAAVKGR